MLGHLALSVAMAFVYGGDDAQMARQLDDASLGSKSGVGFVVSYRHGVSLCVPMQPLAAISGSSVRQCGGGTEAPDPSGAIDLALAQLAQLDDTDKLLRVDAEAASFVAAFAARARREHVTIIAPKAAFVPPSAENIQSWAIVYKPPLDDDPGFAWQRLFGCIALLGLAGGLARRAIV